MTQYNASVTDSSNMKGANKKVKVRKRVQETPKGAEEKELLPKDEGDKQQLNDEPPAISEKKEDVMVFEGLCERMLSAMCLLQTSVSEVLDVKDELIIHNVPSCVQAQMSLSTSRLFRSLTDMYVPSTELVRLVRVFGPQWEQKQLILKQLQEEHERLQRLLSLALQRIQHLETQLHRDTESQHYKNWEKLFVRLMRMGPDISSFEIQSDLDIKR